MPLPLLERLLLYEKKFDKRNLFKDSTASINYSRQPKKSSLIIKIRRVTTAKQCNLLL